MSSLRLKFRRACHFYLSLIVYYSIDWIADIFLREFAATQLPKSGHWKGDAFFDMYFKFLKSNLGKLDLSTALDLLIDATLIQYNPATTFLV
jgi:hypothetical protein